MWSSGNEARRARRVDASSTERSARNAGAARKIGAPYGGGARGRGSVHHIEDRGEIEAEPVLAASTQSERRELCAVDELAVLRERGAELVLYRVPSSIQRHLLWLALLLEFQDLLE